MLWVYTVSCHSCRHIVGGRLKHFSKHPVRYWLWTQVSKLNTRHKLYAWITLGTLMLTDFYVMLVASGTISDLQIHWLTSSNDFHEHSASIWQAEALSMG